jgi:hypothetical protein
VDESTEADTEPGDTKTRYDTWWTPDMPRELWESWRQMRSQAIQFLIGTPILVGVAGLTGVGTTATPSEGSSFFTLAAVLFAVSMLAVGGGAALRRRLLAKPVDPAADQRIREMRAAGQVGKATFAALGLAQLPNLVGFLLVFEGLPFRTYLGFVALSLFGLALYFPTAARWEAAMRGVLG